MTATSRPLEHALAGRPVILLGRPSGQYRACVDALAREAPRSRVLCVPSDGTGPAPELGFTTSTEVYRALDSMMSDPPTSLVRALTSFDPTRSGVVLADSNTTTDTLDGRPVLDSRPTAFAALEWPGAMSDLWERAGARRPSDLMLACDASDEEWVRAADSVDLGRGVRCFPDMRGELHETTECLRLLSTTVPTRTVMDWARSTSDRVVLVPAVAGRPTTVPGAVMGGQPVTLKAQVQHLAVDRRDGSVRLVGHSTTPDDHASMSARSLTASVGRVLAEVGYSGPYAVHGTARAGRFFAEHLATHTTRAHRHAMQFGVDAAWVVATALSEAGPGVCDYARELTEGEREGISLGLTTSMGPERPVEAIWIERAGDAMVRSAARTGSALVWTQTSDGGVLVGSGLAGLGPRSEDQTLLRAVLDLAHTVWPAAGLADLDMVTASPNRTGRGEERSA